MRSITRYMETLDDGLEIELAYMACDWLDILKTKVADRWVVAYLVHDDDYRDIDDMMGDGSGHLYSFHRHNSRDEHRAGLEALGNTSEGDPDLETVWDEHEYEAVRRYVALVRKNYSLDEVSEAFEDRYELCNTWDDADACLRDDALGARWDLVQFEKEMQSVLEGMWGEDAYFPGDKDACLLSCYQHGGKSWSLSGGGMQCRWDTNNSAGVWVPDKCLKDQLDSDEASGLKRRDCAEKYCLQFLKQYNDIINGNVYGCVVETFDEDGSQISEDSCWGFVGSEYAEETLKTDFFEPTCADVQKQYEVDVRTQNGLQQEMPL